MPRKKTTPGRKPKTKTKTKTKTSQTKPATPKQLMQILDRGLRDILIDFRKEYNTLVADSKQALKKCETALKQANREASRAEEKFNKLTEKHEAKPTAANKRQYKAGEKALKKAVAAVNQLGREQKNLQRDLEVFENALADFKAREKALTAKALPSAGKPTKRVTKKSTASTKARRTSKAQPVAPAYMEALPEENKMSDNEFAKDEFLTEDLESDYTSEEDTRKR